MPRPKASVWRERKRRSPKQSKWLKTPEVTRQESVKGKRQKKFNEKKGNINYGKDVFKSCRC